MGRQKKGKREKRMSEGRGGKGEEMKKKIEMWKDRGEERGERRREDKEYIKRDMGKGREEKGEVRG